jgi:hypothetical protein
MKHKTVGIFNYPWPPEYIEGKTPMREGALPDLYRKAVWNKANPRREDYMKARFFEVWPDGIFVSANQANWRDHLADADTIVLLYPDAIGLGFRQLEKQVFKTKKKWAAVRVLNGRRRQFLLNASVRRQLLWRRFLERSMLAEFVAIVPFVILTSLLWIFDWARGHR